MHSLILHQQMTARQTFTTEDCSVMIMIVLLTIPMMMIFMIMIIITEMMMTMFSLKVLIGSSKAVGGKLVCILQSDWNNTTLNCFHPYNHHGVTLCFHDDHEDISQNEQSSFALPFIRAGLKFWIQCFDLKKISFILVIAIHTFIRAPLRQWSQSDWVVIAWGSLQV